MPDGLPDTGNTTATVPQLQTAPATAGGAVTGAEVRKIGAGLLPCQNAERHQVTAAGVAAMIVPHRLPLGLPVACTGVPVLAAGIPVGVVRPFSAVGLDRKRLPDGTAAAVQDRNRNRERQNRKHGGNVGGGHGHAHRCSMA